MVRIILLLFKMMHIMKMTMILMYLGKFQTIGLFKLQRARHLAGIWFTIASLIVDFSLVPRNLIDSHVGNRIAFGFDIFLPVRCK